MKTMPPAVSIDIRGVNLSYGATHVLKNVDLSIRPGELFAFLGPSGCGKTTTLRMIAGFAPPSAGTIEMDGQVISSAASVVPPEKRRRIALETILPRIPEWTCDFEHATLTTGSEITGSPSFSHVFATSFTSRAEIVVASVKISTQSKPIRAMCFNPVAISTPTC